MIKNVFLYVIIEMCKKLERGSKMIKGKPFVKWAGGKRQVIDKLKMYVPDEFDTYYEPFCGSCSILFRLLNEPSIQVNNFVCSDINGDLIDLWKAIKQNPDHLYKVYTKLWCEMNKMEDKQERRKF